MEQLFFQQVVWLYQQEAVTGETIYIDGMKIEAYAKWQDLMEQQINTTTMLM